VLCNDSEGGLTVMEHTGAAGWQPVGSPDFANELDDPFSVLPSLYNDNGQYVDNGWGQSLFVYNGTPYVAYQDRANGSPLQMDVPPAIVNGRTLAPLRAISEAPGAKVQWNTSDRSIVITKGATTIRLQIGSTTALNNGAQVTLDAVPQIVNGRTLAPARFVGEALGAQVNWDAANYQVNIVTASP